MGTLRRWRRCQPAGAKRLCSEPWTAPFVLAGKLLPRKPKADSSFALAYCCFGDAPSSLACTLLSAVSFSCCKQCSRFRSACREFAELAAEHASFQESSHGGTSIYPTRPRCELIFKKGEK